ncbi:flagellar brake protein [Candidatus Berkiella cookevillensis]|uniref:Flagellar brake protein n=1 Tax=Candidatus Berkiella cookevillensis TaxID=437022 RepID=A0A0Q9YT12_9GAMM|nr:flagellar brake protein [Candidatus Berkiella cookevillensis]MCS5708634.1 flagellar brake protein [Candidatus Berkiella cookevillensis]
MWERIKHFWGHAPQKKQEEKPTPHLNHSIYIEKILQNLINSRSMLSIHFPGSAETFVSMLLEIHPNQEYIILDEITPIEGHHLAIQGSPFTVASKEQGVFLSFGTRIIQHADQNELSFYYLPYPKDVNYKQRRQAYRVPVLHDNSLRADLYLPNQPRISAKVADISVSGVRLTVKYNITPVVGDMRFIDQCLLISPYTKPTSFSLEIRRVYYDLSQKSTILCCQFLEVTADKQLYLIELVGKMQQSKIMNRFNDGKKTS